MKKTFILFIGFFVAVSGFAQSFTKFDVTDNNGKKGLNGLAHRTGAGIIDILVPEDFNVSNVTIDYELDENATLATDPLPVDFTTAQKIKTTNTTVDPVTTKEWTVTLKKVKKAPLPLSLDFSDPSLNTADWNEDVVGWAPAAIDGNQASVIRYGNHTTTFIVAFSDAPTKITYSLNIVGATNVFGDALFVVYASADGETWTAIRTFDNSNPILNSATEYSNDLAADIRYVKWVYHTRVVNTNLNKITVTKLEGSGILMPEEQANTVYLTDANLHISNPELVKEISLYNISGSLVFSQEKPMANVSVPNLSNGVYFAKIKYNTSNVDTVKLINK